MSRWYVYAWTQHLNESFYGFLQFMLKVEVMKTSLFTFYALDL